jgi:hypothetical protein
MRESPPQESLEHHHRFVMARLDPPWITGVTVARSID